MKRIILLALIISILAVPTLAQENTPFYDLFVTVEDGFVTLRGIAKFYLGLGEKELARAQPSEGLPGYIDELTLDYTLQDGIKTNIPDYGDIILNPRTLCDPSICTKDIIQGKAINFKNKRNTLVIHATATGNYQRMVDNFKNMAKTKNTATHYVLGRQGELVQLLDENAVAIHASSPRRNRGGIGIEVANSMIWCYYECETKKECPASSCQLPPTVSPNAPEFKYWSEHMQKRWEIFPDTQMKQLVKTSAEIMLRNNISSSNLIRHVDVGIENNGDPKIYHNDPGPQFDWVKFKNDVVSLMNQYKQAVNEEATT
jgi:N-acetyl-anhydromuramyl-L-alanine amidase AmpD